MAGYYEPKDGDTFALWEQTVPNGDFGYLTVYDKNRPYRNLRESGKPEHWGFVYDYTSLKAAHLKAKQHGVVLWPQYVPLKWYLFPQRDDSYESEIIVPAVSGLELAYSDNEPEYTIEDLKTVNPEYRGKIK